MCLQSVSAKDCGSLVERQPVKWLPLFDRGENAFCYFRNNQIFDKKHFPKLERRRHSVVGRDSLKKLAREVIMQIIEWAAGPHFHPAIQIDKRRGKRYCSRDPDASAVVDGFPLSNLRGC